MTHILSNNCESLTHRDVACLFRTPEHKYPLTLWDISAAAPPGLAEKRWRGVLVIIRSNPNLVQPPVQSRVILSGDLSKAINQMHIRMTSLQLERSTKWPVIKFHSVISAESLLDFQAIFKKQNYIPVVDISGVNTQVCQAKHMWVQTSYVIVVFQEAPPLVPRAFSFLSLPHSFYSSAASEAHGNVEMRHSISVWLSKLKFHTAQYS